MLLNFIYIAGQCDRESSPAKSDGSNKAADSGLISLTSDDDGIPVSVPGFIIGYDLIGNQVHISEVDIVKQPVEFWTEDMRWAKIRAAIGQDVPFDILSFRPWVFRPQIAATFQKGIIFL